MKRLISAACLALLGFGAQGASTTTTFLVNATVLDACTVVATPLAFGNFNPIGGANKDATTTIAVLCTSGTGYEVKLDPGVNGTGVTARKMLRTTGAEKLGYALYSDSNRTTNWGTTAGTVSGTGSGVLQNLTVYGRIPSSENVPEGLYEDTVTVTLEY